MFYLLVVDPSMVQKLDRIDDHHIKGTCSICCIVIFAGFHGQSRSILRSSVQLGREADTQKSWKGTPSTYCQLGSKKVALLLEVAH